MLRTRVVAVLLTAACGGSSPTGYGGGNPPPPPTGGGTASVTIQDYSFSQTNLTVKAGTTVTWTNNGPSTHTVTSDVAGQFGSGDLAPPGGGGYGGGGGQTFQHAFTATGSYAYHCSIHATMKATITVN